MYFHMNFEPYRQCGIRCFCFVLQNNVTFLAYFLEYAIVRTLSVRPSFYSPWG
jgi:hypothetical protein